MNKLNLWLAIILIIGIGIFAIIKHNTKYILYCHYEDNFTDSVLDRYECTNLKIVTHEINKINANGFLDMNATYAKCSYNKNDLPLCNQGDVFFNKHELNEFSEGKIKGNVCIQYFIQVYSNSTINYDSFKMAFQKETSKEESDKWMEECET